MHEIDGVTIPFTDTLNIFNGLNYAQFLEAILRIAYYKKDNSEQAGLHDGFKNTLESMFAEADLDLRKRGTKDEITGLMLELSNSRFFEENFDLLAAIFNDKSILKNDHLEMSKPDFVALLKEADVLIKPKVTKQEEGKNADKNKEKKEEEAKPSAPVRKFEEMEVHEAIQKSFAFDNDQLGYVDFLEAIVRIAHVFPFTDEELTELLNFESKVAYFITKFDAKYKLQKEAFIRKM